MTQTLYLLTLCLPLATVLIVFAMRYLSATRLARARLADAAAYRQIAEASAAAQSQTATALAAIQAVLAEMKTRLSGVEAVLKDVG